MDRFSKNKTQTLPTKIFGTTFMTWFQKPTHEANFGNKFVAWSPYHKIQKSTKDSENPHP
jgi:hypothetical protein